jgi:hypothetical protein
VVTGRQAQKIIIADLQAAHAHKRFVFHHAPPREWFALRVAKFTREFNYPQG